jgi:hypothetical protein
MVALSSAFLGAVTFVVGAVAGALLPSAGDPEAPPAEQTLASEPNAGDGTATELAADRPAAPRAARGENKRP